MRGRAAMWLPGLVVVAAAGAATAHGLFEVALGSGTPAVIAWLYPVITDGLALVAYASTTRLVGGGRRYAWAVVVLAAGLSGLAQATYLAGTVGTAPVGLRFGVGAWPAVAAAIAAHLLFLIGAEPPASPDAAADPVSELDTASVQRVSHPGVQPQGCPGVQPGDRPTVQPSVQPSHALTQPAGVGGEPAGPGDAMAPRDRALMVARLHERRHRRLPSVRDLESAAQVSRGTAHNALQELRAHGNGVHPVDEPTDESRDQ